ncbi:MAG: DUF2063 domain-containing protein [Myxococcales bacterium]|nr:DUF2063 domain-containing protein [Myxococcales bacterium]
MSGVTGPQAVEGGAAEAPEVERASATPASSVALARSSRRRARPAVSPGLAETQAWFLDAITHRTSVAAGERRASRRSGIFADALLTPGPQLDALQRMEVYHTAYRVRLVEALADDFPAVRYVVGADKFDTMARRIIEASPSQTRNLNAYGRVLVDWLAGPGHGVSRQGFLHELATLEWALVDVVHAPVAPRLDARELAAIPMERWAGLSFVPGAATRLLQSAWPVNPFFQAWRQGLDPKLPERNPSAVVVYRHGFTVWRMDLSPLTHGLLARLLAGVPLGAALAPVDGQAGADRVMQWFTAWVSGGIFAGVIDPIE